MLLLSSKGNPSNLMCKYVVSRSMVDDTIQNINQTPKIVRERERTQDDGVQAKYSNDELWWWSSGQRACLHLRRSEFKFRWSKQFFQ